MSIEERIAELIDEHKSLWGTDACSCCENQGIPWTTHIAQILVTDIGFATEWGLHDLTQDDETDADCWWTDDPADDFVARDAARDALNHSPNCYPHHELVSRYVTRWQRER